MPPKCEKFIDSVYYDMELGEDIQRQFFTKFHQPGGIRDDMLEGCIPPIFWQRPLKRKK